MVRRATWIVGLACITGAACSSFGGTDDNAPAAGPDAAAEAAPDGAAEAAPAVEGGTDAGDGTTVSPTASVSCEGTASCAPPAFCCVKKLVVNACQTTGCVDQYEAPVACDDGTDCIGGAVCCARLVDNKTVAAVGCARTCTGTTSFVVCSKATGVECGKTKQCVPLATALGGTTPDPDPKLFVCN